MARISLHQQVEIKDLETLNKLLEMLAKPGRFASFEPISPDEFSVSEDLSQLPSLNV